ncbi:hypothetical protein BU24DRAFT_286602 [Aaosphaeria arxii CBS 175.79]|uniref:Uncharacterized protein n=1 Tax=Aaosphaeria arxii CBS 175.79 TaxID=1450172 RepID=A0A6A5XEY4_9PLEO|nr:uncharacterized protein BU24DRAFT_286602 [Aaosphaeria arxii CBS 175.79]KAF2011662.1 hypothetical protein BU24DRAFT_286602 [Aaosphaeria arxii CBS 175.79]
MATTNGALTPPPQIPATASPSPTKRKRDGNQQSKLPNGVSTTTKESSASDANTSISASINDVFAVLTSYDAQPSILNHSTSSAKSRSPSGESDSKRAKTSGPSIASGIESGAYESLESLQKDIELACRDILAPFEKNERTIPHLTAEDIKLQSYVLAFEKVATELISRERARAALITEKRSAATPEDEDGEHEIDDSVPVKQEGQPEEDESTAGRTVLTLYGSAQGPKQLFSSLQQPTSVPNIRSTDKVNPSEAPKILLPLREANLPNIISTTEILPSEADIAVESKKTRTIGEVSKTPAHLPQLSPPKHAKPMTTRGNTITFAPVDVLPKPSRATSQSYANQKLVTGHWLGYGGVDTPKDPTSPTAKQKSRQRALSTGEAQLPPSEATIAAAQQAKEDALFRSVYSTFAPSRDDATTIVPEETKNMIWWQKVGEKRFNETFPVDPALLELDAKGESRPEDAAKENDEFKDAVENFVPVEEDPFPTSDKPKLEKNTEEVLQEISELIETLASHQRNRNASLATNPRTPVMHNSSLATLAGSPSTPSSEEIDVYQMLKSQLSLMISQLPPYAVAKLNGDQLEELNISKTILIETDDATGVLEEDQLSRLAKGVANPAATPSLTRMASTGSTQYPASSSQYSRATPSHTAARPAQTAQTYYPQAQSVHRSPSVHYQRQVSGPPQHYQPGASYGSSTPRQGYAATPGYTQPTPRASYNQPAPSSYYNQRPGQPGSFSTAPSSQFYQNTPSTQQHNRYTQQQPPQTPQNGYFPRPQNMPSFNYGAAPNPLARTESPLKGTPSIPQSGYGNRATFMANGQVRGGYYQQGQNPQYGGAQASTPSTAAAPSGYSQQMMLDRQQQAQTAAQSQARMAAQNSFRQGSGTPQPPSTQYGSQPPVNGTPVVS